MIRKVVSKNSTEQSICLLDEGEFDGWLYTHEGIYLAVRWIDLKDIENPSIGDVKDRPAREIQSSSLDMRFIIGILNSKTTTEFIRNTRRDHVNLYPDDFKPIPIPKISLEQQKPIIDLVEQLNALGLDFFNLRREGWQVRTANQTCTAPAQIADGIQKTPLARAKISWGFHIIDANATVSDARVKADELIRGRGNTVIQFAPTTSERAKLWLARQFKRYGDETLASLEARGLEIPASPTAAEAAFDALEALEKNVLEKLNHFQNLRNEVDTLVATLYKKP